MTTIPSCPFSLCIVTNNFTAHVTCCVSTQHDQLVHVTKSHRRDTCVYQTPSTCFWSGSCECKSKSSTIAACLILLRLRTQRIGALMDEKSDRLTTKKRIGLDLILFGELHRPQSILVGRHCVSARLLGSEVWIQRSTSGRHRWYQKHSIWVSSSSELALFLSNSCTTSSF